MSKEKNSQDSRHASIHEIVNQNKNKLRTKEINQLFQVPNLAQFDTTQLQRHPYMVSNQIFAFFVHELEKWNKKIQSKQITPFYHSQLNRNMFVYSSLKIISLKKANQINKYLGQLNKWYSKNSYNIPEPRVLMKKYNPNEQWQVRKTFRYNNPSEINNYRRRFLYGPETTKDSSFAETYFNIDKKKQNNYFDVRNSANKEYKQYKTTQDYDTENQKKQRYPFQQLMKNKTNFLMKLKNSEIRKQREEQQIKKAHDYWKKGHQRFGQQTCRNFYKGKFNLNKIYMHSTGKIRQRQIKTAFDNTRFEQQNNLLTQIKKGRLKTSQGIRKNFIHEEKQNGIKQSQKKGQQNLKVENIEEKGLQTKWIDNFVVDQDKIDIHSILSKNVQANLRLISNPFDQGKSKLKKKK